MVVEFHLALQFKVAENSSCNARGCYFYRARAPSRVVLVTPSVRAGRSCRLSMCALEESAVTFLWGGGSRKTGQLVGIPDMKGRSHDPHPEKK